MDSIDDEHVVLVGRLVFIGANASEERSELLLQMRPTNNIVAFLSGLIIIVVLERQNWSVGGLEW